MQHALIQEGAFSGYCTFLCGTPVTLKSGMQKIVALSVTEAELFSGTSAVHYAHHSVNWTTS